MKAIDMVRRVEERQVAAQFEALLRSGEFIEGVTATITLPTVEVSAQDVHTILTLLGCPTEPSESVRTRLVSEWLSMRAGALLENELFQRLQEYLALMRARA